MEKLTERLQEILTEDKRDRSFLVLLLREAQEKLGYLSLEVMFDIARFLQIPESAVYSVATFYNEFRFTPLGKHPIKVCMGTACHLAGGRLVSEVVERELNIKGGGITPDEEFSLERVACIGCCSLAPVVVINDTVYARTSPFKVEEALLSVKLRRDGIG